MANKAMGNLDLPNVRLEEMMTKPEYSTTRVPLEKLKKRAYSIQSRLKEMGESISLAHAYEALATSSGYRNWATMRSLTGTIRPDLLLGHGVTYKRIVRGNFHVGNPEPIADSTKLVSIPAADAANHVEVIGPKRLDRTEALLNIAENAVRSGDCLVYLARSSDLNLIDRLKGTTRKSGRTSDLLYMSALPTKSPLRFNPFATGTADALAENITEMIAVRDGRDPASLLWLDRAHVMLKGILRPLVWLRDHGNEGLTAQTLLIKFPLAEMIKISQMVDVFPEDVLAPLKTYLSSVPGYRPEHGLEQMQTTYDHHGYLTLTAEKALEPMVTTYRHVFEHRDRFTTLDKVVQERKILIVLFPDLPSKEWDTDGVISLMFSEITEAVRRRDITEEKSVTVVVDNCEDILPAALGKKMKAASDADARLIFGWQKSPMIPALKRSTSIYLDEKVLGLATAVTPTTRYEFALPSLKV
jgi:hypothetical protein